MPIEIHRIDDRLIHGQVVVGWGQPLGIGLLVMVDDDVAASEWEQELYRMGVPPEMDVRFESVADAVRHYPDHTADPRRGMLITGDIETMERLVAGLASGTIREVNLGGVHHRAGRSQRMRYVFLTPDEELALRGMAGRGVSIVARDVPSARPVPLADVLAGRGEG
jgi:mannose/fructose/N-acetylgalactosamine-specific phosphotransferase system component IIB